ncbi:hypothetical protein AX17_007125 [Amanita inopinata Kibby_2008]|nr:hypothetical protein AX17_007125 [Amanita inopinata Kibby_2008]
MDLDPQAARAVSKVESLAPPIDKLVLGRQLDIPEFILPAYIALCQTITPLSFEEGLRLGMEDVIRIYRIRLELLGKVPEPFSTDIVRKRVQVHLNSSNIAPESLSSRESLTVPSPPPDLNGLSEAVPLSRREMKSEQSSRGMTANSWGWDGNFVRGVSEEKEVVLTLNDGYPVEEPEPLLLTRLHTGKRWTTGVHYKYKVHEDTFCWFIPQAYLYRNRRKNYHMKGRRIVGMGDKCTNSLGKKG